VCVCMCMCVCVYVYVCVCVCVLAYKRSGGDTEAAYGLSFRVSGHPISGVYRNSLWPLEVSSLPATQPQPPTPNPQPPTPTPLRPPVVARAHVCEQLYAVLSSPKTYALNPKPVIARADVSDIGFTLDEHLGASEVAQLDHVRVRIQQ
jgi:hypothetical protein